MATSSHAGDILHVSLLIWHYPEIWDIIVLKMVVAMIVAFSQIFRRNRVLFSLSYINEFL